MEKKKPGIIILIVVLSLLVISLSGFIVYDKFFSTNIEKETKEDIDLADDIPSVDNTIYAYATTLDGDIVSVDNDLKIKEIICSSDTCQTKLGVSKIIHHNNKLYIQVLSDSENKIQIYDLSKKMIEKIKIPEKYNIYINLIGVSEDYIYFQQGGLTANNLGGSYNGYEVYKYNIKTKQVKKVLENKVSSVIYNNINDKIYYIENSYEMLENRPYTTDIKIYEQELKTNSKKELLHETYNLPEQVNNYIDDIPRVVEIIGVTNEKLVYRKFSGYTSEVQSYYNVDLITLENNLIVEGNKMMCNILNKNYQTCINTNRLLEIYNVETGEKKYSTHDFEINKQDLSIFPISIIGNDFNKLLFEAGEYGYSMVGFYDLKNDKMLSVIDDDKILSNIVILEGN